MVKFTSTSLIFTCKGDDMKARIALATVSGRAYYRLVNELKARKIPFLSQIPGEKIPPNIRVVITTQKERHLISHPNILTYDDEIDPAMVVNKAICIAQGKQSYDRVVIGVDPGKMVGIAVLADGNLLETMTCSNLNEAVNAVLKALNNAPSTLSIVKVGDGVPSYTKKLLRSLDDALPEEVKIEVVSETGTTTIHQKGMKDVIAAAKIGERRGRIFFRRKIHGEMRG